MNEHFSDGSLHCGVSTQLQRFLLFSFGSSRYQLGCRVASVSAQGPVEHVKTRSGPKRPAAEIGEGDFLGSIVPILFQLIVRRLRMSRFFRQNWTHFGSS